MACMDSRDSSIENRKEKSRDGEVRLFFGRFPMKWLEKQNRQGDMLDLLCFVFNGIYEVHCNALEHGCREQSGSLQERSP